MEDIDQTAPVETAQDDVPFIIMVSADPATTPLRPNVNGEIFEIPFNTEVTVPAELFDALVATDLPIQIVSQPLRVVAVVDEMSGGIPAGGTGDAAATDTDAEAEAARAELLALLDQSVPAATEALAGKTAQDLAALLAAEQAGKTRVTLIAAIEAAIAALPQD